MFGFGFEKTKKTPTFTQFVRHTITRLFFFKVNDFCIIYFKKSTSRHCVTLDQFDFFRLGKTL